MRSRCDGYYRSGLQRSEDWHAGVRMVKEYHRYLVLFANGLWLAKDHPNARFDFPAYLEAITPQTFHEGLEGRHPQDDELDFVHQTGTFTQVGDRLEFVFRHFLIQMNEVRWQLRVRSPGRLVADDGTVYTFVPLPGA